MCVRGREPMRVLTMWGAVHLDQNGGSFWRRGIAAQGLVYSLAHTRWHGPCLWSALNLPLSLGCVTGKETVHDSDIRKFNPTLLSRRDLTQLSQTLDYATEKHLRTSQRNKLSMFRVKARGSTHFTFQHDRWLARASVYPETWIWALSRGEHLGRCLYSFLCM